MAQLVARTAGGREVASSSLVIPTMIIIVRRSGIIKPRQFVGQSLAFSKRKVRAAQDTTVVNDDRG